VDIAVPAPPPPPPAYFQAVDKNALDSNSVNGEEVVVLPEMPMQIRLAYGWENTFGVVGLIAGESIAMSTSELTCVSADGIHIDDGEDQNMAEVEHSMIEAQSVPDGSSAKVDESGDAMAVGDVHVISKKTESIVDEGGDDVIDEPTVDVPEMKEEEQVITVPWTFSLCGRGESGSSVPMIVVKAEQSALPMSCRCAEMVRDEGVSPLTSLLTTVTSEEDLETIRSKVAFAECVGVKFVSTHDERNQQELEAFMEMLQSTKAVFVNVKAKPSVALKVLGTKYLLIENCLSIRCLIIQYGVECLN